MRAAIGVADREGLAAMSMARVAEELAVGTMSLYTHVPAKAELIDLMVDAALAERGLEADSSGWREQVRRYAERTREVYRQHPWLREVSLARPPLGPGHLAGQEFLCAVLAGIGLAPHQVGVALGSIAIFVDGAVRAEVEAQELERTTGQSADSWWARRQSFWDNHFDPTRYPAINQLWLDGGFAASTTEHRLAVFEFGLDRLLDGIEEGL
ncbi:TetR/AcrR family transcriptional regulator [Kutzneria albida]|uniref:HTH tetR-type domain-containing protein n=1 Tax=Kutzneria albida DSM 43870 TaxID=1449976 RepID=W5WIC3_9PSEU|nr:TetR/AcrR family transcriptional regulator C-terminal domain-containing protein [Kutzneria albida]AHI00944.1 hypothetical protein KALB_7586 [Kutzneria albida DSM 43870]